MAEAIGLAASIIQIAGAGTKLSTSLYNFASSAVRADREVEDLANDVANTSMVLSSVGRLFEGDKTKNIIKKEAIQHAKNLIDQCERIFADINKVVDKRRCISKDGKKARLTFRGKMGWPLKEQKLQFQKARLESLKSSLNTLLQVIELAESQSRGYVMVLSAVPELQTDLRQDDGPEGARRAEAEDQRDSPTQRRHQEAGANVGR